MSQVISADQQVINFAKYWYTDKKFENLLMRNDPLAEIIPKNRIGGQAYRFAAMYGRGGNVSGSFIVAQSIANNNSQSRNAEWIVPPGRIFSVFNITQLELLSTKNDRGAYISALENKFFAGTEAFRKTFAKALYGFGYGEQAIMGGLYGFGLANTTNNATATGSGTYSTVSASIAAGITSAGISGAPTGSGVAPYAGYLDFGSYSGSTYTAGGFTTFAVTATTGLVTFAAGTFNAFRWQFEKYSDIMGIDIGSVVQFTLPGSTGLPSDGLGGNANFYFQVVAINGTAVTFVSVSTGGATPYSAATPSNITTNTFAIQCGSWMILAGAVDGSNNPNFPFGISNWIPWNSNRGTTGTFQPSGTGAQNVLTAWNTQIGTSFCGLTRSVAPDRLAGAYFFNTSGTALSDAILEGLRLARRNGARNKDLAIVMNDVDMKYIINELGGVSTNKTAYFQDTKSPGKQSVQKGLSDINWQFLTSWLERIMDSPYLQQGICWILDLSTIELAVISNAEKPLNDGVGDNMPGTPDTDQAGAGPELSYKLVLEDFINIQPASALSEGPGAQVTLAFYGNTAVHNPAHCVAIRLY